MRLNKVIVYSLIVSLILAIASYLFLSLNISLGLLLGCGAGILSMYSLVSRFKNIDLSDYKYIKKNMKNNLAFRYAIYLIVILFGVFISSLFHVLAIFVGIVIVKVCVYIDALTNKKK